MAASLELTTGLRQVCLRAPAGTVVGSKALKAKVCADGQKIQTMVA
jgi:hypothetical protein